MPIIQRKGAQSSQGFGEFAQSSIIDPNKLIENLFSTYLYTGTGATKTITNNIDISTNGGMVWIKDRTTDVTNNNLFDTARGATKYLHSNTTDATGTDSVSLTSFNTNGFSLGTGNTTGVPVNTSADNFVSWTFRKQANFFDIVTYTGTGANRTISHNLGSTPGCIIVKRTDTTSNWQVYHSGLTSAAYSIQLNLTNAQASAPTIWNSTAPTSSVFSVGTSTDVNASGGTYVAYLFASNAGGFGSDGLQNVITCGSYTGNGSATGPIVNLGYEPQFLIIKDTAGAVSWPIQDINRQMAYTTTYYTFASTDGKETSANLVVIPNATGFQIVTSLGSWNTSGHKYIYIAIRRGPMAPPTLGTSVFSPVYSTFSGTTVTNTGFTVDLGITKVGAGAIGNNQVYDRLRGSDNSALQSLLTTNTTGSETSGSGSLAIEANSVTIQSGFLQQNTTANTVVWAFSRAPNFFDEVCYTGTGSNTTQAHNLGVVPELIIIKERDSSNAWQVYSAALGNTQYLVLNTTAAAATGATRWNSTTPTSSVFSIGTDTTVNASAGTYVAYLFASCPGVSKVGTYSGTGATQTINCGFAGGARFVLIKRTDTTGDWYSWDTARGMVSGTDPYILLNTTAAQVNANNVYTATTGFQIVGTGAGINASGGTYIFLAIA
jgi:hypothetical protein